MANKYKYLDDFFTDRNLAQRTWFNLKKTGRKLWSKNVVSYHKYASNKTLGGYLKHSAYTVSALALFPGIPPGKYPFIITMAALAFGTCSSDENSAIQNKESKIEQKSIEFNSKELGSESQSLTRPSY